MTSRNALMGEIPVSIIRHPKERISKCSLTPLQRRPNFRFFKATKNFQFDATSFILLSLDATALSTTDAGHPLLLLDSTWRLLPELAKCVKGRPIRRTLPPGIKTAYPRRSKVGGDPLEGLASVEALYVALKILGQDDPALLAGYHWKELFLRDLPPESMR